MLRLAELVFAIAELKRLCNILTERLSDERLPVVRPPLERQGLTDQEGS
jgi:hypothetical protein